MPATADLTGKRYGRLTAVEPAGRRQVGSQVKHFWLWRCDCGVEVERAANAVKCGNTTSCGCALQEAITKHGGYRSALYKVWHAMIERCRNQNDATFKDYGGRGIKVCARWMDFATFRDDMGTRPTGGSLERNDVNGDYEPSNCRWATAREQANNRRNNRQVTYDGRTLTVAQWARETGLGKQCILHRLNNGWPVQRALTTSSDRSKSNVDTRRNLRA